MVYGWEQEETTWSWEQKIDQAMRNRDITTDDVKDRDRSSMDKQTDFVFTGEKLFKKLYLRPSTSKKF